MSPKPRSLADLVAASVQAHPDRPALRVESESYSYAALQRLASRCAHAIDAVASGDDRLCAIYARRSLWAYAGILGALAAGRGYVPLNPNFPAQRTGTMLALSGASVVVAERRWLDSLAAVLKAHAKGLAVLVPDGEAAPSWAADCPQHRFFCADFLEERVDHFDHAAVSPESTAYLLFTSGTTGTPKGIAIRERNVLAYLGAIADRYDIGPDDRFSQNFELTFDLSVHDMFVCWGHGACLCVPSERAAMAPARFVRDHELTLWFSTPSTAAVMSRLRMLRPGAFPSLRWSLFCGEALPDATAAAWQRAAPHSTIENLYGPTEATIACTGYSYDAERSPAESVNGLVSIGRPFDTTRVAILDDHGSPVADGDVGELVLGGEQIAPGYWLDAERTEASFRSHDLLQPRGPWYHTGDLASVNERGDLIYRGRRDDQLKVMGHRVELQEIEAVAREAAQVESLVALGWPRSSAGADGIILFVTPTPVGDESILEHCRARLPEYMVPKEIHRVEALPLSSSGKIDRKKLIETREGMA